MARQISTAGGAHHAPAKNLSAAYLAESCLRGSESMSRSHEREWIPGGNVSSGRNRRAYSWREAAESSATGRAGLNRSVTPSGTGGLISLPLRVKRAALKNKVLDRESQTRRLQPELDAPQGRPINNRPQVTNRVTNLPHKIVEARKETKWIVGQSAFGISILGKVSGKCERGTQERVRHEPRV
jgi:hypothetical protein